MSNKYYLLAPCKKPYWQHQCWEWVSTFGNGGSIDGIHATIQVHHQVTNMDGLAPGRMSDLIRHGQRHGWNKRSIVHSETSSSLTLLKNFSLVNLFDGLWRRTILKALMQSIASGFMSVSIFFKKSSRHFVFKVATRWMEAWTVSPFHIT